MPIAAAPLTIQSGTTGDIVEVDAVQQDGVTAFDCSGASSFKIAAYTSENPMVPQWECSAVLAGTNRIQSIPTQLPPSLTTPSFTIPGTWYYQGVIFWPDGSFSKTAQVQIIVQKAIV